ncbi:MAG: methyltransferase domain-containing protein [Syntrophaceae bacterium]|nr:methyltransferase domain-containing protein [Syntrophaceae bacterium]
MLLKRNNRRVENDLLLSSVENLWGTDGCYFVQCAECSLSYASPLISGDSTLYKALYDNSKYYKKWKWEYDITLKKILLLCKQNSFTSYTLLEIGAGNGQFVKKIPNSIILPKNILTTEFSIFGKSEINRLGIECIEAKLINLCSLENKEKFAFICMFQVLEHLDELDQVFNSLSFLLKPKGHIFIAVPNNYHREMFESIGIIEDIPPIHISRWNKKSFTFAAYKYGWEIVDHKIEHKRFIKNYLIYLTHKYKMLNRINDLHNRFIRIAIKMLLLMILFPLNLKHVMLFNKKEMGIAQWIHLQKT